MNPEENQLTENERRSLWMQVEILKQLSEIRVALKIESPESSRDGIARDSRFQQVLTYGWEDRYDEYLPHMEEPPHASFAIEVRDILTMHRALYDSYEALGDKDGIPEVGVRFWGFDGNDESGRLAFARFLIEGEGCYQELAGSADNLSSHLAVIDRYRSMVQAWKADMGGNMKLTRDEMIRLAEMPGASAR